MPITRRTFTKQQKADALAAIYGIAPLPDEQEAADLSARLAAVAPQLNDAQSNDKEPS